jgi:hypothetical protein
MLSGVYVRQAVLHGHPDVRLAGQLAQAGAI